VFVSPTHPESPLRVSRRRPPGLGEHTVDVPHEAGLDAASIDALLAAKAALQGDYNSTAMRLDPAAGIESSPIIFLQCLHERLPGCFPI